MAHKIKNEGVISYREQHPENLEYELMLARKELLLLQSQNQELKATSMQTHNDLIQARKERDQTANLLRNCEEELEVANIEKDMWLRQLSSQYQVTDWLNDRKDELMQALAASNRRVSKVGDMCLDSIKETLLLRSKVKDLKKENEAATERMWGFSNESNAMVRKLKRWRGRARAYKAAFRVHKMRGLVVRNTMEAKIRHLTRIQRERL